MDDATKELQRLGYPQNIIDATQNGGVGLDMRLRFAMQLLTSSPVFSGIATLGGSQVDMDERSGNVAKRALEIADALFNQAQDRGWVQPFDQNEPLSPAIIEHARRVGAFEFHKQAGFQKEQQANVGKVATLSRPGVSGLN